MEFPKRGCLQFLLLAALTAFTLALLIACGQRSGRVIIAQGCTPYGDSAHQPLEKLYQGPMPDVWSLDTAVGAMRSVSAETTVSTQGWQAFLDGTTGTNGTSQYNVETDGTALTLRAYNKGEYSYGVYGQAVGADPKPLRTLIDSKVCKFGGGRDDEIPLCYYVSIADYTIGAWRWFGPFGKVDVLIAVNSETLKSRFKSPSDNFYLCVLASNGSKAASSLPSEGSTVFPVAADERVVSQGEEDPGGVTIEIVETWLESNLLTEPAVVTGLQAAADTAGVSLSWDSNIDPDVDIYQIFRAEPDTANDPILLQGVLAPNITYADTMGMPGREYRYLVRARNNTGYGGTSEVRSGRLLAAPPAAATTDVPDYVTVSWPASLGATGYTVYRADTEFGTPASIAQVDSATLGLNDTEPAMDLEQWYWVQALGEDFDSELGVPASGMRAIPNIPPVANLTSDVTKGDAPLTVNFDASGSYDLDGSIVKYEWDWESDGTYDFDSGVNPTEQHTFGETGAFTSTVRVTDNDGLTSTASQLITANGPVWAHTWGGNDDDWSSSVALDGNGNVYVLGRTSSYGAGMADICLVKYDVYGNVLWQKTWGKSDADYGWGVKVDVNGNAFVAGGTKSFSAGDWDAVLLKYNSSGGLVFSKTWGGNGDDGMGSRGIDIDSNGDVCVVGTTTIGEVNGDIYLLKYSSDGSLLWQKSWGGTFADIGLAVAADGNSSIFVTGSTYSYGAGLSDVVVLKYDSLGNLSWQNVWGDVAYDEGRCVDTDLYGNVVIAGLSSYGASYDSLVLKYDTDGNLLFSKIWGGPGEDSGEGVYIRQDDSIYIAGYTASFGAGDYDVTLLTFAPSGNLVSEKAWGDVSSNVGLAVTISDVGSIYVAGWAQDSSGIWQDVAGNLVDISATQTFPAGLELGLTGTEGAPVGTTTTPTGVIDNGGGLKDFAILKYQS